MILLRLCSTGIGAKYFPFIGSVLTYLMTARLYRLRPWADLDCLKDQQSYEYFAIDSDLRVKPKFNQPAADSWIWSELKSNAQLWIWVSRIDHHRPSCFFAIFVVVEKTFLVIVDNVFFWSWCFLFCYRFAFHTLAWTKDDVVNMICWLAMDVTWSCNFSPIVQRWRFALRF